ncbi:hypothetical protein AVEN_194054-1 [Araneus ventricosus]|uniref:Uncharacterized protein n=1 Tax=Araneus ventricosus TaxID=182803 RepID=A0A4Y2DKB9_ARAVE|nr:hypothetical protein AVEN_194054-1 [Araneus ventricosus]
MLEFNTLKVIKLLLEFQTGEPLYIIDRIVRVSSRNKRIDFPLLERKLLMCVCIFLVGDAQKLLLKCYSIFYADKSSLQVADHAIARRLILEDSMEVKPVTTRKLRRRPNDPLPVPEKRRKTLPNILFIAPF